jgi:aminocarboxymuconate-semialdehyde decarboxylase
MKAGPTRFPNATAPPENELKELYSVTEAESLFSCSAAGGAPRAVRARTRERGAIDVHTHAHIATAEAVVGSVDVSREPMLVHATELTRETNRKQMAGLQPQLTTLAARLADMDRLGIAVQAVSPSPFQLYYWADAERGRAAARAVNDGLAELVAGEPKRFVAFGTVPLQAPQLAVAELERLVRELGFRGVEIATNVCGEELSAPRFRPFFAKAEELGVLVFLHPNGFTDGARLREHYFINVIGNPLDSTIALSHLIFDGVLERYPALELCVAHGGGYLPAYAARMDHAYRARPDARGELHDPPSVSLRRVHFDTVVFSHAQLEHLVREYGADRILLGSDYPYDMAEDDPAGFVAGARLSAGDRAKILRGNAARLLKLD